MMPRPDGQRALSALALIMCLAAPAMSWAQADPGADPPVDPEPPPPPGDPRPLSDTGSLSPDVYIEDMNFTLRRAYNRTVTISRHDPKVAYIGSYDGYVWKTTDGGRTWDESRLVVEGFPFRGDAYQRMYFGRHRTDGKPEIRLTGNVSKPKGTRSYGNDPMPSAWAKVHADAHGGGAGGGRGAAANTNFGIGLPGGAPRLQNLVRKFGKITAGINIKQTLLYLGQRPTEVRFIVEHPTNPKVVFACTAYGLFKTEDGGLNWVRTFTGTTKKGMFAAHVAVDPQDERRVFLATGEGLYISKDNGDNFMKAKKQGVGEGWISYIFFHPKDSRYIFACTDAGLLRSTDGGETWRWIYYTTFLPARVVTYITVDAHEGKKGYISTFDGIFGIDYIMMGGLDKWMGGGGLMFTGVNTFKIVACPKHKGHIWAQTIMKIPNPLYYGWYDTGGAFIMESIDDGDTWTPVYSGTSNGSIQWFTNHPKDPDLLWIAWSRTMSRMRRLSPDRQQPKKIVMPDIPPIKEAIVAALRYLGVDPGQELKYRSRIVFRALIPKISMHFHHYRWRDFWRLDSALYPTLPYHKKDSWPAQASEFVFLARWDLSDIVFNMKRTMFGRIARMNEEVRAFAFFTIHRLYSEYAQLRMVMRNKPPRDMRVRLMYRSRVEELENYLNFITGGYLKRWQFGDRPKGYDTKWWEKWKPPKK